MGIGAKSVIRTRNEGDSANRAHHPIRADGSYFAKGVVELVGYINISVGVERDSCRRVESRLQVGAICAAGRTVAGDRRHHPVRADWPDLANGVISEIRHKNVCVRVNGETEREVESRTAVCAIRKRKVGRESGDGRHHPICADLYHFTYDVSGGIRDVKIPAVIPRDSSWTPEPHIAVCAIDRGSQASRTSDRRHAPICPVMNKLTDGVIVMIDNE